MEKITKLAIFDFDGTLLDTPLPEFGKKVYKEKTGQDWPFEGWWGRPLSLDMTIFDMPVIPEVINSYKKEKAKDEVITVMLTGRMTKLSDSVIKILNSKGLTFDEYHFNKGGSTDISKIRTMEKLLDKYSSVKEIEMWDDRVSHIPVFKEWGNKMVESGRLELFNINVVPAQRH